MPTPAVIPDFVKIYLSKRISSWNILSWTLEMDVSAGLSEKER
jgi:hypothetical protein